MPTMMNAEIVEGKRLVRELKAEIKRPAARKPGGQRSAKVYVGSQEVGGGMTERTVRYWIQRSGIDWIPHLKGEEGRVERLGPLEAPALVEEIEDRGLDVGEFVTQLRSNEVTMMTKLAKTMDYSERATRAAILRNAVERELGDLRGKAQL